MNIQTPTAHVMEIMDRNGHTTVTWDPRDPASVRDARTKFNEMIHEGYTAFAMNVVSENGVVVEEKGDRVTTFDPQAGKIMMVPQLRGG